MPADRKNAKPRERLSRRQEEVLLLIGDGLTMPEIGDRLGITSRTVKAHVLTIRRKFDAPTMRALIPSSRRYFQKAAMIPRRRVG